MASLEGIVRKLREICYDLSPRDLSDWGLATVVEDMLSQMEQRTGIDCQLYCDIDVPVVPAAVLLHIYRIVQESLNNAEKYAQPSRVTVTMEMEADKFIATVADNGKGFDMEATGDKAGRAGGYGMGSLKERADLIRCFFPTKLFINSTPGKGTKVRLEIDLARFS
jgi:signal transduction histidine kinase